MTIPSSIISSSSIMASKIQGIYKIFLFIFLCFWASTSNAEVDTLNQGEVLNSTASLSSKNGLFSLRFRVYSTALDSTPRWYLMLSINDPYILWVANRDRPIADKSGVLVITETGELMIRYGDNGAIGLYTNKTSSKVAATLQDDGNFVLKEINSGEILWQSFDNPTDSLLPGMKLGINHKTGKKWLLTSWFSPYLPPAGAFTLEWDPVKRQLISSRRGKIFWTSGRLSNGGSFANMPGSEVDHIFEVDTEEEYIRYKVVKHPKKYRNGTHFFMTLAYDGSIVELFGIGTGWKILNSDSCNGNSTYGGCERWDETTCRRAGDKFQKKELSDNPYLVSNKSLSSGDCKDLCWKDCSCVGVQVIENDPGCTFLHGAYRETQNGNRGNYFYIITKDLSARDILNQGDKLNSSTSLVSKNGLFSLQFNDLSSSDETNKRWYLTLWYKSDDGSKISCWVANRDEPIPNNSGVVTVDETGQLVIRYGDSGVIVVYSNQTRPDVAAVLQDDGNFVLKEVNSGVVTKQILWQSFDNLTDSFLPGMKLGISEKTGKKRSLTSWLSDSLPTPGAFTLEWDSVRRQLILFWRGEVFWTSGKLGDKRFANAKMDSNNVDYSFDVVPNNDGEYLTYKMVPNQFNLRSWTNITGLRLLHNGSLIDQRSRKVILDSDLCDGNSTYGGCERWKETTCRGPGDKFKMKELSYSPNRVVYNNASLSLSDCKKMCWKNCSCVGVQAQGSTANGTGCVFLQGTYRETENGMQGDYFYIIIRAPSENKWTWKWILISFAIIAILIVILVLVILLFIRWRRLQIEEKFLFELMSEAKELEIDGKKGFNLKVYSVSSIMKATNSFSSENKLGEGGFGPVYKGVLLDGQEIAIKRLSGRSRQGLLEFKNELVVVAKLQHTNLVRLLGFCIQGAEKILVYEYMPNKSLDFYMFDESKRAELDWCKCFKIIKEITQGLLYLHKYSRLRIIHRDLKAGNILLDKNMNPKISDFGMARILNTSQSEANTKRIAGTRGYMSPEYAIAGIFSVKSDVFSFGVLMLEIVSGSRSNSIFDFEQPLNLVGYAWKLWTEGAALELMHPTLRDSCSEDQVLRCINVALLCVEEKPEDRPKMSVVISMLTSEGVKLPMPKQPAYSNTGRSNVEVNSSEGRAENCSINSLTITVMDGR